jgi:hypothetical protein
LSIFTSRISAEQSDGRNGEQLHGDGQSRLNIYAPPAASPLVGCDLTRSSEENRAIGTNRKVIDGCPGQPGIEGQRHAKSRVAEVRARPFGGTGQARTPPRRGKARAGAH